jgi:hypothetical protein
MVTFLRKCSVVYEADREVPGIKKGGGYPIVALQQERRITHDDAGDEKQFDSLQYMVPNENGRLVFLYPRDCRLIIDPEFWTGESV